MAFDGGTASVTSQGSIESAGEIADYIVEQSKVDTKEKLPEPQGSSWIVDSKTLTIELHYDVSMQRRRFAVAAANRTTSDDNVETST